MAIKAALRGPPNTSTNRAPTDRVMEMEWRPVVGSTRYQISTQGDVIGPRGTILRHTITKGRHYVSVRMDASGKHKKRQVHHMILEAFLGPRPPGALGCHLDDNKDHNSITNLAWQTPNQNQQDSVRNGTHAQTRKDRCPAGHSFMPDNVYWRTTRGTGTKRRECKLCADQRSKQYYAEHQTRIIKQVAARKRARRHQTV
jgi:hypothetical protein